MLILLTLLLMFALGSILICIMVMLSIDENKKDYAVLNALGIRTQSLALISFLENGARYLLSTVIGLPCGIAAASVILSEMGSLKSYYPLTGIGPICLASSGIALLYLLLGMVFSVTKALRVDPALALNT